MHWLANIRKWRKPVQDIKVIHAEWNQKMKIYEEKEVLNIRTEKRKLADIEFLKMENPPGSFTRCNEVFDYLDSNHTVDANNKHIYVEVRLAKNTYLSLKPSSSIFMLKGAGRNLTSDDYTRNLITYSDNFHSEKSITITDLQNVLLALNKVTVFKYQTILDSPCFRSDNYVAAFWIDGNGKYECFLVNVIESCNNHSVLLSYFKKVGQSKEVKFGHLLKCLSFLKLTLIRLLVKVLMCHIFVQTKLNAAYQMKLFQV